MPKKKNQVSISKQLVIEDIRSVANRYRSEGHTGKVTRNYYLQHGQYGHEYAGHGKWKAILTEATGDDDEDSESETLGNKLILLEDENKQLKSQLKKTRKSSAVEERLIDEYKAALVDPPKLPKISNKILHKKNGLKAALCLSDWHVGQEIDPSTIYHLNEYNSSKMILRGDDIINQFLTHCHNFKIQDSVIILDGDMIHGSIHDEHDRTNELNVLESILYLQQYIQEKIKFIASQLSTIEVYILVGNHSRVVKGKPYYADKVQLNYEYLLGKQLQLAFENEKRIKIEVPESPFEVISINNHRILVTHGDILAGGSASFAGIPLYGLAASSAKLYGMLSQAGIPETTVFDSILIGHYHISARFPIFTGNNLYINGCLSGTDSFSVSKMKSNASVSQQMLMIDKEGKIFFDPILKARG